MTAPASIPALIAEGRRLIAAATDREAKGFPAPLPWYVSGCHNMIWGDDGDAITGPEPYFERPVANLIVFAVNNLAALLAVAEAAVEWEAADAEQRRVPAWSRDTDLFERLLFRNQSATRALRAAARGEEKTK